jgi:hypothetical protein
VKLSVARRFANSTSMNLRHAAAFALVGWYLMAPPLGNDLKSRTGAPLYEWQSTAVSSDDSDEPGTPHEPFLTLVECEAQKAALKQGYLDESKKNPSEKMFLRFSENAGDAQCVKSDDPRLMPPELQKLLKESK